MKKIVKISRVIFLVSLVLVLGACGNEQATQTNAGKADVSKEKVVNADNVKGIVKAIKKSDVRFKLYIGDEGYLVPVGTNAWIDDTTYGFDQPHKNTSIWAYALNNKLNEEQADGINSLLKNGRMQDGSKAMDSSGDVRKEFPEAFYEEEYPYKGADIDYATLSNVKVMKSDQVGYQKITADVTIHLHLTDGTQQTRTYPTSYIPKTGNTKIKTDKYGRDPVQEALHADVMNQPLPTDRFIYVDKK